MKFCPPVREPLSLNMTPLIDVVFLLLIFFMTSTTFSGKEASLEVTLPSLQVQDKGSVTEAIRIDVSAKGEYRVNTQVLSGQTVGALKTAMQVAQAFDAETVIVIAADERASYQAVMRVMDAAGQLGYEHIQLMGEQR